MSKAPALRLAVDARVLGQRGIGRYLANLLRAVAESRADVAVRLYLGRASVREAVPADPRFSAEDLGGAHPAWAEQVLIPRLARGWGADVLHYPDNSGALRSPVSTVLTLHDTMWLRPLAQAIARPTPRQRLQDAYRKFVCPRAARAAAAVVTISRHSADCLRRDLGLDPAKIFLSVEGVDPVFRGRLGRADAARRRARLGLRGPYVLCSGASDRRKNIDRLIQAFAVASSKPGKLKGAQLAVTSLRPGEAATTTYADTARAAGVGGRVLFLPYISDGDLKALYQGAAVFAFPSLWEGFGLPVLEAFAMGCPVLAAAATALPEVAGAGAVYADPLDVEDLARGLRRAAGPASAERRQGAAAQLKRYTWAQAARQHWRAWNAAGGRT
ncbi:MAG TPA: glycosyltransferase family 1 protein [bacterium]|nr:glycosyltransferase family 1 protein [bacterium]